MENVKVLTSEVGAAILTNWTWLSNPLEQKPVKMMLFYVDVMHNRAFVASKMFIF